MAFLAAMARSVARRYRVTRALLADDGVTVLLADDGVTYLKVDD